MTATPDYEALWNDLYDELTCRRRELSEVAGDLDDEGKDGAERTYGRAEELRDTVAHMDRVAERAVRYADLDERQAAAIAVLAEHSIELGQLNDLSVDQLEALAEVARSWGVADKRRMDEEAADAADLAAETDPEGKI